MSYNNGINFGYDQIFVNPDANDYYMGSAPAQVSRNSIEQDLMKKIKELESPPTRLHEQMPHSSTLEDMERERLRQAIMDLQRKNDMLTMFIVFLVVFVIMQYNTLNLVNQGVHYANTLTMSRLGPPATSAAVSASESSA